METTLQQKCSKCLITKNINEFNIRKETKSGYRKDCKKCMSLRKKLYATKNKEKLSKYSHNYYEDNKERLVTYQKEYSLKNKENIKNYRLQNKNKISERYKKYYKENFFILKEKKKIYNKNNESKIRLSSLMYRIRNKENIGRYRAKNSEYMASYSYAYRRSEIGKDAARRSYHKRRALKISTADGSITKQSLLELRNAQNYKCYHCGVDLDFSKRNAVHLDHYMPLSKGGSHTIENVVWSCADCNIKKSSTVPSKPKE